MPTLTLWNKSAFNPRVGLIPGGAGMNSLTNFPLPPSPPLSSGPPGSPLGGFPPPPSSAKEKGRYRKGSTDKKSIEICLKRNLRAHLERFHERARQGSFAILSVDRK